LEGEEFLAFGEGVGVALKKRRIGSLENPEGREKQAIAFEKESEVSFSNKRLVSNHEEGGVKTKIG